MKIKQTASQPKQKSFSEDVKKRIAEKITTEAQKEKPKGEKRPKSGKGL